MTLRVTKLECARSQLETAIRLYFEDRDPISIHTLTSAAYDVLHDIGRPRGLEPIFKGARFLPPEEREAYKDLLNRPRNFFKHADLDPQVRLKFEPEVTTFLLFDACEFYMRLTGDSPEAMNVFRTYFHVRYPEFVTDSDLREEIQSLRQDERLAMKSGWLPLLERETQTAS
jgi:hypothetical protein